MTALKFQTNDQDDGGLGDILKALVALDGKTDLALGLSHELVAYANPSILLYYSTNPTSLTVL